jgi:hypothetical protein
VRSRIVRVFSWFIFAIGHRSSFGASSSCSMIARLRSRGRPFRERATMSSLAFLSGVEFSFFPNGSQVAFKMAFFKAAFYYQLYDL